MKRNWMIAALLLVTTAANALVVSVNGYGEIPAGGMELTLTEAEEDIMSGKMRMETAGPLLCSGELTVTISRSNTGLEDEFCCADQCIPGNGETTETQTFLPGGMTSWFVHYYPASASDETVVYTFAGDGESRVLKVHYRYTAEGTGQISAPQPAQGIYTLGGAALPAATDLHALPAGTYIVGGKKTIVRH